MLKEIARSSARTLLAAMATVVSMSAAHAGNIRGSWDPQFNSTFTGVGFLGEITFFVPDPCLSGTPGATAYVNDVDACAAGGMYLVDAEVVLYNYPNANQVQSTITFAPPLPPTDPILGILVEYDATTGAGKVVGLDTNAIGPRPSNQNPGPFIGTLPTDFPAELFLQFSSGFLESFPFGQLTPRGAYLVPATCSPSDITTICFPNYSEGARSNPGVVAFVPEPGSLALLLSAMGVGWLVRRRRAAS